MFREWSYRVLAYDYDGSRVPVGALEDSLYNIVSDVRGREDAREACLPVGRLTADNRDIWAVVRFTFDPNGCSSNQQLTVNTESPAPSVIRQDKCQESSTTRVMPIYRFAGRLHPYGPILFCERRPSSRRTHCKHIFRYRRHQSMVRPVHVTHC